MVMRSCYNRIVQNFDGGNFDGYRLFKYLMENILTDGHCNCCIVFEQFDGLNFDCLAGKRQKRQNFPPSNFVLYDIFA